MGLYIKIHKLGPIQDCLLDLKKVTVLTGPQACGKSTIAKVAYFFLTIPEDFFVQASAVQNPEDYQTSLTVALDKRLRNKFLGIFGSSWAMSPEMTMECQYAEGTWCKVSLKNPAKQSDGHNFVIFTYSSNLKQFLGQHENLLNRTENMEDRNGDCLRTQIHEMFQIDFETIYIPAGRGMITLLTDQINYIFSAMDIPSQRSIDYCTRQYVSRILRLRPSFSGGARELLQDQIHMTNQVIDRKQMERVLQKMAEVLRGDYVYEGGEEHLRIASKRFVKINYASSGQQEIVWVLNFIFYYLLIRKQIFLIVEEPEAHLYPDAQKQITELLGMFANGDNSVMITTHSPYILGQLNNMLLGNQLKNNDGTIIPMDQIIQGSWISAQHVHDGRIESALTDGLIDNSLIDGASKDINDLTDRLLEQIWSEEGT